ncbi:unnamed protein product [Schistosoma margrebowiei]|uniref:Uncharacterized protein n=1 Tax=Schistosoma margrebowiei TaxID=48269 RepID=A0A183MC23_9TREM|nr:unnamed protein product [Schistosoma margrebowiei]
MVVGGSQQQGFLLTTSNHHLNELVLNGKCKAMNIQEIL